MNKESAINLMLIGRAVKIGATTEIWWDGNAFVSRSGPVDINVFPREGWEVVIAYQRFLLLTREGDCHVYSTSEEVASAQEDIQRKQDYLPNIQVVEWKA